MSHLGGHKIMFTVLVIYTTGSVFSNIVRNGVDDNFFLPNFIFGSKTYLLNQTTNVKIDGVYGTFQEFSNCQ